MMITENITNTKEEVQLVTFRMPKAKLDAFDNWLMSNHIKYRKDGLIALADKAVAEDLKITISE